MLGVMDLMVGKLLYIEKVFTNLDNVSNQCVISFSKIINCSSTIFYYQRLLIKTDLANAKCQD